MLPIKLGQKPSALDDWGTVASLGSVILEGDGKCAGKMEFGAPTDAVSSGWFSVSKSVFKMVYPFNEHATVVEGSATLTDESTGETQTFVVGDSWFIKKGTPILWKIETASFTKNYFAVV